MDNYWYIPFFKRKGAHIESYHKGVHGVSLYEQPNGKFMVVYTWGKHVNFYKNSFKEKNEALKKYFDILNVVGFQQAKELHNVKRV